MRTKMEDKTSYPRMLSRQELEIFGLAITCVGRTRVFPQYHFGPLRKTDNTLLIICGGRGGMSVNSAVYEFKAGDCIGHLENQTYTWWTDPELPLEHYWITVEGRGGLRCLNALGLSETTPVLRRKAVPETEITLLEQLMECCRTDPYGPAWKAVSLYYDVCASIAATTGAASREVQTADLSVAEAAYELIKAQYTQSISVNAVAQRVGVTPEYLAAVFRQHYGITPRAYLMHLRLKRATALLKAGVSVKEACFSVGYKDPNYFATLYRKKVGVTPSSLRRTS